MLSHVARSPFYSGSASAKESFVEAEPEQNGGLATRNYLCPCLDDNIVGLHQAVECSRHLLNRTEGNLCSVKSIPACVSVCPVHSWRTHS